MLQERAGFCGFCSTGRGGPHQAAAHVFNRFPKSVISREGSGAGYRVQPTSFVLSILFHVAVVTGLLLMPRGNSLERDHKRPIFDELIQPEARKIVWFPVPKPKPLPEVSAQERIGTFPKPRAPQKAETAIIATAPKPKSVKQFIWQAVPKIEIHQDQPAPNLIARAAMAIPAPPPPPEPKPKVDKPDTQGAKSPAAQYLAPRAQGRCEQGAANSNAAGGSAQAASKLSSLRRHRASRRS